MTVVCCWLDGSDSRQRITALADARATRKVGGEYKVLADSTSKLFRLRVRCHSTLDRDTGAWDELYYETEIGLGFSGYCVEAYSIIALLARTVEDLSSMEGNEPLPEAKGIAELTKRITEGYFAKHNNLDEQIVDFLIFGYSPVDRSPWLWEISHRPKRTSLRPLPIGPTDFHVIGSITTSTDYRKTINNLRRLTHRHRKALRPEDDVEEAVHWRADRRAIEDKTLEKIQGVLIDVGVASENGSL